MLARAETPAAALDVLNAAVVAALKEEVTRKLIDLGAALRPTSRADSAAHLKDMEPSLPSL